MHVEDKIILFYSDEPIDTYECNFDSTTWRSFDYKCVVNKASNTYIFLCDISLHSIYRMLFIYFVRGIPIKDSAYAIDDLQS